MPYRIDIKERTVTLQQDGQMLVTEVEQFVDTATDEPVGTGRSIQRFIDIGDDVSAESLVIQDAVNGNLHSQARKDARDIVKAEEDQQ
jgi:hypothetical protein